MSLYGRVDSTANQTAVGLTRGNGAGSATETIVFVDETEAGLASNKTRGITAPGWWAYRTYTDAAGNTRHKAEHLMILTNPEANADETLSDDTIAADVAVTIAIGTQPADRTTSDGASITGIFADCCYSICWWSIGRFVPVAEEISNQHTLGKYECWRWHDLRNRT